MTDRLERLRDVLAGFGADAGVVSHPANRHYFSGFPAGDHAPDESYGILVVGNDDARLFTSPTNLPWAEASLRPGLTALPWSRPWPEFIGKTLSEMGAQRVVFEDRALTVADHAAISGAATGIELVPAGGAFHALRAAKDDHELEAIRKAARITDAAFSAATRALDPGITERELAWNLDRAMRDLGASGSAFPTIVAAGPHGARPHHEPSERPILAGEPVVIDMGALVDGYCADLTRTICIGEMPPIFRDRYNRVLQAQDAALAGVRAGMSGRDADAVAREAAHRGGAWRQFVHGLGHGVGLLIHEFPSLGVNSEDVLETGHVVTIEPGVYFDDWGGIRIEDLCVVTARRARSPLCGRKVGEATDSMIDTGDLRKGLTLDLDGRLVKVIEFAHNKQGRGSAQVRMTLRDLRTGALTQHTVQAGAKFSLVRLERQHVQYLYPDGDQRHFMDTETFDQIVLNSSSVGEAERFIRENDVVDLLTYDGEPIDIELPPAVHADGGRRPIPA